MLPYAYLIISAVGLVAILVSAAILFYLLPAFKIKTSYQKALAFSAAVFVPLNLIYALFQYFNLSTLFNLPLFLVLVAAIIFPIKYLYKTTWQKTLLVSLIWLVASSLATFILKFMVGLILLAAYSI